MPHHGGFALLYEPMRFHARAGPGVESSDTHLLQRYPGVFHHLRPFLDLGGNKGVRVRPAWSPALRSLCNIGPSELRQQRMLRIDSSWATAGDNAPRRKTDLAGLLHCNRRDERPAIAFRATRRVRQVRQHRGKMQRELELSRGALSPLRTYDPCCAEQIYGKDGEARAVRKHR